MHFLVAGNLANHGYFLTKLLRKNGFKADLLARIDVKSTEDPKYLDSNLTEYPEWIKFWNGNNPQWKFKVVSLMRGYDLIQASTELPIFAYLSRKPFISFTTGADIAKLASENSVKGFILRRAYHDSKVVIFPAPYLYKYVQRSKIKRSLFIPLLWDYEKFLNIKTQSNEYFTIFHPTNHVFDYKKNDLFLKAFIKIVKENKKVRLIMINRGPDFPKSLELINKSGVAEYVTILPRSIPQSEIANYYAMSDVIVDQFGVGSTGLIGQEVMACGKPLIQYINNDLYCQFYGESPPILNARTEIEIYEKLRDLIVDPSLGLRTGKESQEWILKHHNHESVIKKYINLYNLVYEQASFEKINEVLATS